MHKSYSVKRYDAHDWGRCERRDAVANSSPCHVPVYKEEKVACLFHEGASVYLFLQASGPA